MRDNATCRLRATRPRDWLAEGTVPFYLVTRVPGEPEPVRVGPFTTMARKDARAALRAAGLRVVAVQEVRGCAWCGRAIDPHRTRARYCTTRCRVAANRARHATEGT